MAKVYLCCGKVCTGKSTYSKYLEEEKGIVHFSADEWMLNLYEHSDDNKVFLNNLDSCKRMIDKISLKFLKKGHSVVLDFGFWSKGERDRYKKFYISNGFEVDIIYFPISEEKQIEFMNKRQNNKSEDHYIFDIGTLKILNSKFEEPIDEKYTLSENIGV